MQSGQKLGFLRDLLKFRTRKFRQLGPHFVEAHFSILAHLDRVTTLNFTLTQYAMFQSPPLLQSASYLTCPFLCPSNFSNHRWWRRNFESGKRSLIRFKEKDGKKKQIPVHDKLEEELAPQSHPDGEGRKGSRFNKQQNY